MRTTSVIMAIVLCGAFVCLSEPGTVAGPAALSSAGCRVGVVSVRRIFEKCRRNEQYRARAEAEKKQAETELKELSRQIESDRAQMSAFKAGSKEHLEMVRQVLDKEAGLQWRQEFFKQKFELRDQRWTEDLYTDILAATGELAAEEDLDLVLEVDQVQFPASTANELMLTIRTHKVLFNGGCPDITDRVIARLDEMEIKDPQ